MSNFSGGGKLQEPTFKELVFPYCGAQRPELLAGPQYGVDVSLVQLPGGMAMAMTSDPLSLIPTLGLQESAWLSVHLMANDMATTSVAPMYAQLVLNLPPALPAAAFKTYWLYIHQFCQEIGVAITGGHTGQAPGQQSTMAGGGTMVAIGQEEQFLLSSFAQPGHQIIVTKEAALIATAILALSFPETVRQRCGVDIYQHACNLFYETSSLQAGLFAPGVERAVSAMHDVTEGGVLGAIYEMAMASGCGARIDRDLLAVGAVQGSVCAAFAIDPCYCVGAGSMVITAAPENVPGVLQRLRDKGIAARVVGEMTPPGEGIRVCRATAKEEPVQPGTDPYWAAFYNAFEKGLK
ncbi:MAG: AIR synthase-related protein [Candidatus Pseudobacter hemicellulosilyticus]|uniref:AIR synthase-related protein n=1 Tax=Candidatus Pseudobacter hemicellulosilyticus TaxID=3121375 RepID=A0AAJ5WZ09_9BACT|nr:MAG: AIR synthase-related protein [Pseudobacter sp.]